MYKWIYKYPECHYGVGCRTSVSSAQSSPSARTTAVSSECTLAHRSRIRRSTRYSLRITPTYSCNTATSHGIQRRLMEYSDVL